MKKAVIKGRKTEKEKFAGANATYTIESMMHDGKALQSGTSHNFGDGFAKAFNIQYTDKDNTLQYVHQTSWGLSTRLIGAIIMVHGDNNGLVLPPAIAPIQTVIIPIASHKEGVLDKAQELANQLKNAGIRVHMDTTDKMPGWKFAEYEMKGVPLRLEIGPKDLEKGQVVLARRDNGEKLFIPMEQLLDKIPELLESISQNLYQKALQNRAEKTFTAKDYDTFKELIETKPGFIKAMWCENAECEAKIKEDTGATARCMPFEQETIGDTCVCCGKPAKTMVYWGKSY